MVRQSHGRRHVVFGSITAVAIVIAIGSRPGRHGAEAAPTSTLAMIATEPARETHALPRLADAWRRELSWSRVREEAGGFVQVLHDGGRVELTFDPRLQHATERALEAARGSGVRYGSAVLLSVEDGRVLALAGREPAGPDAELAVTPWAPAASIFKLVTAAALVDAGVGPEARVCYHDGIHSVEPSNLRSSRRYDRDCNTLAFAVAKSQNAIMARLANDRLSPTGLSQFARALGFGERLPVELPTEPSAAELPETHGLAFARVAAGFWQTTLSPLHGAWLAATLARGGVTPTLRVIDRVVDAGGRETRPGAAAPKRVLDENVARAVARMMVGTTEFGTARLGFHDRRSGRPILPGVAVAGKTGSLCRAEPYLGYSWFVGFAPAERPEIAVAVLLASGEDGHKRAHQVAAELLSTYFDPAPELPAIRMATRTPDPD